ncbi:MAG: Dihydrolipoamide acetyltransferase component of pyruvate dehydrogenase complex [uncultured Solirubrobacteraceae bacterium]|uniref:Dihydrolipoamide acetyltransferase component of pyruvate dehydrogenase complex n=1 Tax=uncultured Solirubrobacteraceae bacterium TaxID=1162706 RepID=A0A6J4SX29_9ACTN|nr:MAG: Dihydrolipoamide acetyltransferase component of pyruvate dehydrogenase complex [uncultured Solirubrobacteraceae bacterium]
MADVAMPRLSDSMEEGTILKWLKSDGDEVTRGEELVEIETDKANMTYEADSDGTLSIVAKEGDTLPVGETIARIGEGGGGEAEGGGEEPAAEPEQAEPEQAEPEQAEPEAEPEPEPDAEEAPAEEAPEPEPEPESAPQPVASGDEGGGGGENGRVKASPVAKRMAREMGLELSGVTGTGPGGRIVKADVEAAAKGGGAQAAPKEAEAAAPAAKEEPAPAKAEEKPEPKKDVPPAPVPASAGTGTAKGDVTHEELTRLQQVVARRMAESKATAPEFVLNIEVEMDTAVELRKQLKEMAISSDRPAPSFNDMVIKACALALREFPRANGAYRDGRFELYSRINVGMAVAGQDALVVPTIYDADRKSLGEIARDARTLAERVRAGAVTPPELSGGTFTVSNLGMFGIKSFTAVINPPQSAILAVGAMTERAVVREGELTTRHIMDLTLACDHRILYGADAAQFLGRIRELLEQPLAMAL